MVPYKHFFGQTITTDVVDVAVDRAFLAHINIHNAVAATSNGMVDGAECSTGQDAKPVIITEFAAQPDAPRNIVVKVAATTAGDVAAGNIVVSGINCAGKAIAENFAVTADTPATITGNLAFKEVKSVTVPVQDGASVTVDVGWGDIFGLPYMLPYNTVFKTYFGGTEESTAPTVVTDVDEIEKNTIDLNSTPDGEKDIDIYLII